MLAPMSTAMFLFSSFSTWFLSEGGPIISNTSILQDGVVSLYLDDRVTASGVTEEDVFFANDTGLSPSDVNDLKAAFEANMELLYDKIVELGAFVWQMFDDGPGVSNPSPMPPLPAARDQPCQGGSGRGAREARVGVPHRRGTPRGDTAVRRRPR